MSYGGDDSSDGENEEEEGPGRPFSSFGSWLSSCRLPGQRTHWKFQEKCPWGCRGKAPTGPHLSGEDLCLTLFKRIHRVNLFGVLVLTCSESEPGLNELMFQRSEQWLRVAITWPWPAGSAKRARVEQSEETQTGARVQQFDFRFFNWLLLAASYKLSLRQQTNRIECGSPCFLSWLTVVWCSCKKKCKQTNHGCKLLKYQSIFQLQVL